MSLEVLTIEDYAENVKEEAKALMDECREAFLNGDTEAINDYLELEDDYIFDII